MNCGENVDKDCWCQKENNRKVQKYVRIYKAKPSKGKNLEFLPIFDCLNRSEWFDICEKYGIDIVKKGSLKPQIIEKILNFLSENSEIKDLKELMIFHWLMKTYFQYNDFKFGKSTMDQSDIVSQGLFTKSLYSQHISEFFDGCYVKYCVIPSIKKNSVETKEESKNEKPIEVTESTEKQTEKQSETIETIEKEKQIESTILNENNNVLNENSSKMEVEASK